MEEEKQRSIVELPQPEWMQLDGEKQEPTPTPPPVVQPAPSLPKAKVAPGSDYQETAAAPTSNDYQEPKVDRWTDAKPEAAWADESDKSDVTDVADVRPRVSDIGDGANGANKPYGLRTADEAVTAAHVGEPEPKFGNMKEVLDWLSERKAAIHLPTKEEMEKERRRRKTEGIISALADGASAVSNLIFTTQYAPDMYRPENSMTEKMKERYDKLKKERDADADRYFNYAMMIGKIKDAQDAKEYQRGRDALQDQIRKAQEERAAKQAEQNARLAELREQLTNNQITKAEYEAKVAENKAKYADEMEQLKIDNLKAGINQKNAAAGAAVASAAASYARADRLREHDGPRLQLEEDELLFDNTTDYDRAVMFYAPNYGVPTTITQVTERYEHGVKAGQAKKVRIIQRPVKDIAADIERAAAKRKKSNNKTMPGVGASTKMPGVK